MSAVPHVELIEISKRFGSTEALRRVTVSIRRGTVHALVGENGAGKSTLGKIISGVYRPDEGVLKVNGRPVHFTSPRDALESGIAIIHQELSLVPQLRVDENVFLGVETTRKFGKDSMEERFAALCQRVGFHISPRARVRDLHPADRQKVEILRALARDAELIIMDEPTARLGAAEVDRLLEVITDLRDQGVTIVYVSHFLREVLAVADVITVLRNGEVVLTEAADRLSLDDIVTAMLGRTLKLVFPQKPALPRETLPVLRLRDVSRRGIFEQVSLEIRKGEIVGIFGLVGSGRTELARSIIGAEPYTRGTVELESHPVRFDHPADAIRAGVFYLPESRSEAGLHLDLPVRVNVTLPHLEIMSRYGVVSEAAERRSALETIHRVGVVPADIEMRARDLSGGNQQKALLGKWLVRKPKVLILDEPTRGVDIGAKTAIYDLIVQLASEGIAVLLISSELEEVLGLSHRVLVMRRGRIVAEFDDRTATEESVLRAALGSTA